MPIDERAFRRIQKGAKYLEEWDRLGARPDKRVVIAATIPFRLKKQLELSKNKSAVVENALSNYFKHRPV